jgi:hypothetical protein
MAIWNILRIFGTFYDHLVHFVFIWYILYSFWCILYSFGTFFRFWYHVPRKIWQPWSKRLNLREILSVWLGNKPLRVRLLTLHTAVHCGRKMWKSKIFTRTIKFVASCCVDGQRATNHIQGCQMVCFQTKKSQFG